jgi:hypothetical protein
MLGIPENSQSYNPNIKIYFAGVRLRLPGGPQAADFAEKDSPSHFGVNRTLEAGPRRPWPVPGTAWGMPGGHQFTFHLDDEAALAPVTQSTCGRYCALSCSLLARAALSSSNAAATNMATLITTSTRVRATGAGLGSLRTSRTPVGMGGMATR